MRNILRRSLAVSLLSGALIWMVVRFPEGANLRPPELVALIVPLSLMTLAEAAQFVSFGRHRLEKLLPWSYVLELVSRRGTLNALLPLQGGTVSAFVSLNRSSGADAQAAVRFTIATSVSAIVASVIVATGLLLSWAVATLLGVAAIGTYRVSRHSGDLVLTSYAILAARVLAFDTLFTAVGMPIGLETATAIGVAMNALNQFPITPANVGVREWTIGGVSAALGLSSSVGILVGLLFLLGRVVFLAGIHSMVTTVDHRPIRAVEQ